MRRARLSAVTENDVEAPLARASGERWRAWLRSLAEVGRRRLAALGLTLVLGFLAGVVALAVFADLSEDVMEQETMQVDLAVLAWLRQFASPGVDVVARGISLFGSEGVAVSLVVLLVLLAWQRRWGASAALLLVTVGAQLLNEVLKLLFQRTRPTPMQGFLPSESFSFPSGHAMVSAAFYLFLAYLTWHLVRGWWRIAWTSGLLVLVLLIGVSRLYLAAHYLSDVVAGYVAGFLWTDAVILGGRILSMHRLPRRAAESGSG